MKRSALPLLSLPILLAACGPDAIISDLPSPNKQYHVEVRRCPQGGSITWSEKIQISILKSGESENCLSVVSALIQFDGYAPADQLQMEWISDTELRAWHPRFAPQNRPPSVNYKADAPVKVVFSPK